jgi:hypothetical protein
LSRPSSELQSAKYLFFFFFASNQTFETNPGIENGDACAITYKRSWARFVQNSETVRGLIQTT